ncbi:MAG: GNAT family N-acetyltransferase [Acidobacteriaceae bacterium]|nr:GNAT family N-acetyltransferase [Acidobacteriaceae bacterium]
MKLRPATVADLHVVLRHRREMFREMGGDYEEKIGLFENASEQYFQSALQDGSYVGLLGEISGSIVAGGGVVIAPWPGSPLNFSPRRAWILNIYVEPEYRRQGLARTMAEALVSWCRENGFQSVALHASEYGRSLYEKLGFRPTNEMRLKL